MATVVPTRLFAIGATALLVAACSSSGSVGGDASRTQHPQVAATGGDSSTGPSGNRLVVLGSHGLGPARFGSTKARVTAELTRLLGQPSGSGANPGCGPAFTEVHWGELAVEFHDGLFNGYRDINRPDGDLQLAPENTSYPPENAAFPLRPKAKTAAGIALGDSLGQAKAVYSKLSLAGADRWKTPDGLSFLDNSEGSPAPPRARIIEIRIGTCGSY
jgi:hypothetical protein